MIAGELCHKSSELLKLFFFILLWYPTSNLKHQNLKIYRILPYHSKNCVILITLASKIILGKWQVAGYLPQTQHVTVYDRATNILWSNYLWNVLPRFWLCPTSCEVKRHWRGETHKACRRKSKCALGKTFRVFFVGCQDEKWGKES